MSIAARISSTVRASASLVVVSPCNSILFMLRPSKGTFPKTHVFPGGALDESDISLEYCAVRETYEETGLLILPQKDLTHTPVVHERGRFPGYREAVVSTTGIDPLKLDWSSNSGLSRLSEWTTPTALKQKKRFVTQFFVYFSEEKLDFSHISPNNEVQKVEWLTATQALEDFKTGKVALMPPQFYLLSSIKESGVLTSIKLLSDRKFQPSLKKKYDDGRIELDWGKGESGILTYDGEGVIRDIQHVRNHNISQL
ncbi:hypothetical protein AWJ20_5013 [Sugiyamaella lignohabitans]|uniref:Nudix hydrolase domain-containing protein n=1 Tax=Sugiyamaella lignohabitans TaxID=796027 RepID=A0A161HLB1_9ASCO|nr:uncharacterized protein AWJ20_5013 [Sugiyamaella lignohabitans]ANB14057.1 hypothetical protein AWJ20_5013 [Sugiyamaella lignohabitans]